MLPSTVVTVSVGAPSLITSRPSPDAGRDPTQPNDSLVRHVDVEYISDDLGPAVNEVAPAVLDHQGSRVPLGAGLVLELERAAVVKVPDHSPLREAGSIGQR